MRFSATGGKQSKGKFLFEQNPFRSPDNDYPFIEFRYLLELITPFESKAKISI